STSDLTGKAAVHQARDGPPARARSPTAATAAVRHHAAGAHHRSHRRASSPGSVQSVAEVGAIGQLPGIVSQKVNTTVDTITAAVPGRAADRASTIMASASG